MSNFQQSFIKLPLLCFIVSLFSIHSALAQDANFTLNSEILGESRNIIVHLPEGYDSNQQKKYPVIYMLDAGNDDVLMAETVTSGHRAGNMPEAVVVAIENIRRGFDFTPPYEAFGRGDKRQYGNGDKFLSFIKDELIPKTEKKLRTNGHKIFMGHSWGGAFASYVLSKEPDLFDGLFIFSPAIAYGPTVEKSMEKLFVDLDKIFKSNVNLPEFIYMSVGTEEHERYREAYEYFAAYLKENISSSVKLNFNITQEADHMANPEMSLPLALKFAWKNGLK